MGGLQDTAGQERFDALGPIYYRDADGKWTRLPLSLFLALGSFPQGLTVGVLRTVTAHSGAAGV